LERGACFWFGTPQFGFCGRQGTIGFSVTALAMWRIWRRKWRFYRGGGFWLEFTSVRVYSTNGRGIQGTVCCGSSVCAAGCYGRCCLTSAVGLVWVWFSRFDRLLCFGELAGAGIGFRLLSWDFCCCIAAGFLWSFPSLPCG